jgi:hypothetical protein
MVSSFAGRNRNVGLGRSGNSQRSPPRRAVAPTTTDALRAPRRGTTSAHALKKRGHPTRGPARHSRQGDASFTRSEGPCTSIVAQLTAGNRRGVTRSAEQRGRATLGNQEEPAPWLRRTDGARLVTHHRRRKACSMVRSRKGRRLAAVVPTRIRESRSKCPHVVVVAEIGRRHLLAPNTLVRSAPKRVAARVNGGLARGHRRR